MGGSESWRLLAFTLLFIFLANLATWSGGAAQMAHELGHGAVAAMAAGALDAAVPFAEPGENSAPAIVEHQALHAVDHMQFFPPTPFHYAFATAPAGRAHAAFLARQPTPARADLPFRPPRQRF